MRRGVVGRRAAATARFWQRPDVALDMGTEAFRLAHIGGRSVWEIPARVALDPAGRVVASGRRALAMEERIPDKWRIAYPVEMGRLSHPAGARRLLRQLLSQSRRRHLWKARLWVARPVGVTPMEKSVLENFLRDLPVRGISWCDSAVAAAVGAGLEPEQEPGLLVVDLGAQRGTAVVLSFGKPVLESVWPGGGATWTDVLRTAIEDEFRVRLPRAAVEILKRGEQAGPIYGQDRLSGRVRQLELPEGYVTGALARHAEALLDRLGLVLTRCSPALRMDVQRCGVLCVGGGGLVPGLAVQMQSELGIGLSLPRDPGRALIAGLVRLARPEGRGVRQPEAPIDLVPLEV